MTHTERHEQLQSQLRDATARREQLSEQLQQTVIGIHQLQGALAVLQAIMQEEAALPPPGALEHRDGPDPSLLPAETS